MSDLEKISDAVRVSSERREQERAQHTAELGDPVVFLPFEGDSGHGIGWFKRDEEFVAYRKYSNGYELHPTAVLSAELITTLYQAL